MKSSISKFFISLTILVLAFFGLGPVPSHADGTCILDTAYLEKIILKSQAEDLRREYKALPKSFDDRIDARRLINLKDWQRAKTGMRDTPQLVYSERTYEAWKSGVAFVDQHVQDPVTPDLLRQIHRRTMKGLPFHGFEGRRARRLYDEGKLDQTGFKKRLSEIYEGDAAPSGTDHETLAGKFRDDPLDDIRHSGSEFSLERGRYFTARELEAVRKNPHMRVDESSVHEFAPGKFEAKTYFTRPAEIPKAVDRVFKNLSRDLSHTYEPEQVIRAVAKMEKDLIVIHPFLDGNGRTVRLLGDLIFKKYGLPPPVLMKEEEITMSLDEYVENLEQGMQKYVEAKRALARLRGDRHAVH